MPAKPLTKEIWRRLRDAVTEISDSQAKSQAQIARDIGITPASLHNLMSGRSKAPSRQTLLMLQLKFDLNPEWITEGIGEKYLATPHPSTFRSRMENLGQAASSQFAPSLFAPNGMETEDSREAKMIYRFGRIIDRLLVELEEKERLISELHTEIDRNKTKRKQ